MLFFVIFASLLVSGSANICCVPNQFEATQGLLTGSVDDEGHTAVTYGTIGLSYDATNQRVYTSSRLTVGNDTRIYSMLQLFEENSTYLIENNVCVKTDVPMPPWKSLCIPDNATLISQYTLGPPNNTISVKEYNFTVSNATLAIGLTDKCIPVIEKTYGSINTGRTVENHLIMYGLQNLTVGIAHPEVFNIPSICPTPPPPHFNKARHIRKIRSFFNGFLHRFGFM